jgi:hypothetical protein
MNLVKNVVSLYIKGRNTDTCTCHPTAVVALFIDNVTGLAAASLEQKYDEQHS